MISRNTIFRMAVSVVAFATLVIFLKISSAADNSAEKPKNEVRVYEVFGMGCPACQGGLAKLVKKVEGVSEAEVNWKDQRVKVKFSEGANADDEKIFEAIRQANFTPGKRLAEQESKGKTS